MTYVILSVLNVFSPDFKSESLTVETLWVPQSLKKEKPTHWNQNCVPQPDFRKTLTETFLQQTDEALKHRANNPLLETVISSSCFHAELQRAHQV